MADRVAILNRAYRAIERVASAITLAVDPQKEESPARLDKFEVEIRERQLTY